MRSLQRRRWVLGALAAAFLVAIVALAPRYNAAQTADDAASFRAVVGSARARFAAAAVADLGFAASYGLFALAFGGRGRVSRAGALVLAAGAVADLAENALVLVNLALGEGLTDLGVQAMRGCGVLKWVGVGAGAVLLVAGRFADRS